MLDRSNSIEKYEHQISLFCISCTCLDEDSVDAIHLHTACQVLAKEREIIGNDQGKIYVPSIELASIYAQRPTAVLDGNQNVLTAFADLHQTCSTDRTSMIDKFPIIYLCELYRIRPIIH